MGVSAGHDLRWIVRIEITTKQALSARHANKYKLMLRLGDIFDTVFSQGMGLGCFIVSSRDHSGRHLLMLSGARDMIP